MSRSVREFYRKVVAVLSRRVSGERKQLPGSPQPAVLTGAPPKPRLKTYSAQTGFVYQYVYRGQRGGEQGTEFVFSISIDRRTWHVVSITLADAVLRNWEEAEGREISRTMRYAIAKLMLFDYFDEQKPTEGIVKLRPGQEDIARKMETLGLL